ncbi:steroid 17-alpha-hydroxylase/17,20 lyase-like [Littorina saxatilis]|uniref:Cytochrome P450 n=1 Tax=Littorina saxatilis TaxID=31220 RepID=A0AAN9BHP2_9CAEN
MAFNGALTSLQDLSARAPGSTTTQALVLGTLVGLLAYILTKKRYRLPPGPFGLPLLGNLLQVVDKEEVFYVKLRRWARERYGPVITVYLGTMMCVVLNTLEVVTEAMISKGTDFAGRPYLHSLDLLTDGSKNLVMTPYSPEWKLQRKIALQAIRHYLRGTGLEKVVHRSLQQTVDKMAAEPGPFDPHHYTSLLMFNIVDSICFGEVKAKGCPEPAYVMQVLDDEGKEAGSGLLEDVIPLLRYCPTPKFRRLVKLQGILMDYIFQNIAEHRKSFSPDNIRDLTDSILLAQIETARDDGEEVITKFDDTYMKQTIGSIFTAGIDTSRMTLNWTLFFLAGHPEVQKRAQAEIDAATGSRQPGLADRARLQYTEAVLYESMRLGVPVPLSVPRKTLCDTTVGGYEVPKDTMVLVNLWAVMNDPDKWSEPEKFKPERFLDEQGNLMPKPEGWIPFSVGRRACIGETVVKPELTLILSCLLKTFTLSLPPGAPCTPTTQLVSIALNPPKPFQIVVTPR